MTGLAIIGVIFIAIISTIFNGFALSQLWSWFVVTTFGLQAITIPQAIGISMVIGFLTGNSTTDNDKSDSTEKIIKAIVTAIFKPVFALIFGYIIYLFIV